MAFTVNDRVTYPDPKGSSARAHGTIECIKNGSAGYDVADVQPDAGGGLVEIPVGDLEHE